MKYLLVILLAFAPFTDLNDIAKANQLKKEAKEAFINGDYKLAVSNYRYLLDTMGLDDDNIRLNLANAYYHMKDTTNALNGYQSLTSSADKLINSVAHQQLGVMATRDNKLNEALQYFKDALKKDPTNEEARYNYELVKKLLKEQEQQQQEQEKDQDKEEQKDKEQEKDQQKQQDQQKQEQEQQEQDQEQKGENQEQDQQGQEEQKDQQEQDQKESDEQKEGDEKDEEQQSQPQEQEEKEGKKEEMPPSTLDKLQEMNISEEKARMILEAMKNQEIQYLQQRKRSPKKPKKSGKPDW